MTAADLVFLCLPDEAAIEAVKLIEDPRTKVIDASTAHRCDPQWAYGFSELGEHLEDIRTNTRVANPAVMDRLHLHRLSAHPVRHPFARRRSRHTR
ncbi:MAG: hypothetical protein ACLVJ6_13160 [Merdibacter sp.]